jgi:hypothetical protein
MFGATSFSYEHLMRTATLLTKEQMQDQNTARIKFFHQCLRQNQPKNLLSKTKKELRGKGS